MFPLFETICIEQGSIQNVLYHELRFANSYFAYYQEQPSFSLFNGVDLSTLDVAKKYKLKISYNASETSWAITEYLNKVPTTLQLVFDDTIDYSVKYTDREKLNALHEHRNDFDDVLIVKNGLITDACYANILFKIGEELITPKKPLLHGTCRARLLATQTIKEKDIHFTKIAEFDCFQLINAMNDYDSNRWISVDNIHN